MTTLTDGQTQTPYPVQGSKGRAWVRHAGYKASVNVSSTNERQMCDIFGKAEVLEGSLVLGDHVRYLPTENTDAAYVELNGGWFAGMRKRRTLGRSATGSVGVQRSTFSSETGVQFCNCHRVGFGSDGSTNGWARLEDGSGAPEEDSSWSWARDV